jgi:hypothetical protein
LSFPSLSFDLFGKVDCDGANCQGQGPQLKEGRKRESSLFFLFVLLILLLGNINVFLASALSNHFHKTVNALHVDVRQGKIGSAKSRRQNGDREIMVMKRRSRKQKK